MDIGSLFLILAIMIGAGAFIARPLLQSQPGAVHRGNQRLSSLQAERERVLSLLYDTEMDHTMGKILTDDYQIQRAELMTRGAEVLKQIDELVGDEPTPLERAIIEERDTIRQDPEGWLEAEIARMRGVESSVEGYCRQCGQALIEGDHFCSRCGASTGSEESSK